MATVIMNSAQGLELDQVSCLSLKINTLSQKMDKSSRNNQPLVKIMSIIVVCACTLVDNVVVLSAHYTHEMFGKW